MSYHPYQELLERSSELVEEMRDNGASPKCIKDVLEKILSKKEAKDVMEGELV